MAYDEEFDPETDYMSDEEQQDSPVPQPMPAPVQVPVVPQQAPSQPVAAPERTAYLENYDPTTGIRNRTAVPYVPRQAPAAPLVDINWRALQNVQADQAAKAVAIAMQYQGMRGYQAELAKGTPAAQALAKWAPAMFYGSPAAGSAVARAIQPKVTPQLSTVTLPNGQTVITYGNTMQQVKQPQKWVWEPGQNGQPGVMRDTTTGAIRMVPQTRPDTSSAAHEMMKADVAVLKKLEEERSQMEEDNGRNWGLFQTGNLKERQALDAKIDALKQKIQQYDNPKSQQQPASAPQKTSATTSGPAQEKRITTKAEFDALPSGAIYIGKDDKKYRKP